MTTIDIARESLATFASGSGTVGTTPQSLGSHPVTKKVVVRANGANAGVIMIGPTAAQAGQGYILAAGERSPEIYVSDISNVWIVGSVAGQNFSWIAS